MTSTPAPTSEQPRRHLRRLGTVLTRHIDRLQRDYLNGSPAARAGLAQLRRAVGKPAGSVPEAWPLTIGLLPEERGWDGPEPSWAEQATHAALTLYALHQQSMTVPAHTAGVSFGRAVGRLRFSGRWSEEAITRRFMAVSTAESIEEVLVHGRGLITQLRAEGKGLDYAALADDLQLLLTPGQAQAVRLRWGRDFYRTTPADPTATTDPTDDEK